MTDRNSCDWLKFIVFIWLVCRPKQRRIVENTFRLRFILFCYEFHLYKCIIAAATASSSPNQWRRSTSRLGDTSEARRERGSWVGGSEPPRHQLEGLGSAVNSPSWVRRKAPAAKRFLSHLSAQVGFSWHFSEANYYNGAFITLKMSD